MSHQPSKSMKYGQMFVFKDKQIGKLPSECLSFKYGTQAGVPLIFIQEHGDGTFMYCSKVGQHTRKIEALKYCEPITNNYHVTPT